MQKPTVSVLMPAFNASATITEAINSVLAQTYDDFEIVVVDDGSTDTTVDCIESLSQVDTRIRLVRASHQGVVSTANRTLKEAKGTYLTRLDADDMMEPDRIRQQMLFVLASERPEQTLVGTRVRFFPRGGLGEGTLNYERWLNALESDEDHARNLLVESTLAHPTILGHRALFEAVGGYRPGPFPEDYDLILRIRSKGTTFHTLPEVLTHWREHEGRLTHTDDRYSFDAFRRAKAMHIKGMCSDGSLEPHRPIVVWGAGSYGRRFMRALEEQNIPFSYSVDIDPKKIGRKIRDDRVEVLSPEQLMTLEGAFVFLAVATPGARQEIQDFLGHKGLLELRDFLAVQ
jgi:glycosyltransferase involved in cell wall biosynthesis